MSRLYSQNHRALQDRFDTRRMADFMENGLVHAELAPEETAFVESRDMFFLSTVDPEGRPTVSYKGGAPGFACVPDPATVAFPCYDGNGMYYSMGNLISAPSVGLLFIDFETPHRLRLQGNATIRFEDELLGRYPEAQFMVRVKIEQIWVNCPRYIHKHQKIEPSKYVPVGGKETPMPAWKRIDIVQEALPAKDQGIAAEQGGVITVEQYSEKVRRGEA